jgi:hypothetical protein
MRRCVLSIASLFEATAGFRVTTEVTLLTSYYTRRSDGSTDGVNEVGVSAVWSRRW